MERRCEWIIAVRLGCLVFLLTSSLQTNWCHLIPSSVLKYHWSRASILRGSTLVIAQHSDPYRKIGRIHVSYNFSFVGIEMRDFQKWLSRLCVAAWVIALRRMMSGVLRVDEWMREPRYTTWSTTSTCWPELWWSMAYPEQFYLSGASLPRLVWKQAKLSVSEWNLSLLSWSTRCSTTASVRRLSAHCHQQASSASIIRQFQVHYHLYQFMSTDRAFAADGPRLWNSLPTHVRQLDLSLDIFRHKLKTYLIVRGTSA